MSEATKSVLHLTPCGSAPQTLRCRSPRSLINAAFRVELPFIEGDRVDAAGLRSYMAKGKFLAPKILLA